MELLDLFTPDDFGLGRGDRRTLEEPARLRGVALVSILLGVRCVPRGLRTVPELGRFDLLSRTRELRESGRTDGLVSEPRYALEFRLEEPFDTRPAVSPPLDR